MKVGKRSHLTKLTIKDDTKLNVPIVIISMHAIKKEEKTKQEIISTMTDKNTEHRKQIERDKTEDEERKERKDFSF